MDENCERCGALCPAGTLDNGLCLDCNDIGKMIPVYWGQFGIVDAKVETVTRNGVYYAKRWNMRRGCWTTPRALEWVPAMRGFRLK